MTNATRIIPENFDIANPEPYFPVNDMTPDDPDRFDGIFRHLDPMLGLLPAAGKGMAHVELTFTRSVRERVNAAALVLVREMWSRIPVVGASANRQIAVWAVDKLLKHYVPGLGPRPWHTDLTPGLGQHVPMGGVCLPRFPKTADMDDASMLIEHAKPVYHAEHDYRFAVDPSDWFVVNMAHTFYHNLPGISARTSRGSLDADAGLINAIPKFSIINPSGNSMADKRKYAVKNHAKFLQAQKHATEKLEAIFGISSAVTKTQMPHAVEIREMYNEIERMLSVDSHRLPGIWLREYQKVADPNNTRHAKLLMLSQVQN